MKLSTWCKREVMLYDNHPKRAMVRVSGNQSIVLDNIPREFFPLSIMTAAEVVLLKKKLKTELAKVRSVTKKIEEEAGRRSCGFDRQVLTSGSGQTTVGKEMEKSEINKQYKNIDQSSDDVKKFVADRSSVKNAVPVAKKCGPPQRLEGPKAKRQRMDSGLMQHCADILKKLMTHPSGWAFKHPVDPVKSNIPDYFSIISAPMDLGTVKSNLEKKSYLSTKEFAADVRLTFSNAMLYNGPNNKVHIMAKELKNIFNQSWTSLEAEWSGERSKVAQGRNSNENQMETDMRRGSRKTPASHMLPERSLSSEDKKKLRTDLLELSKGKLSPDLSGFQSGERSKVKQGRNSNEKQMETHDMRRGSHKTPASQMLPKRSLSSEDKKKLRKDLLELSKGKLSPDLSGFLQKFGLVRQSDGRIRAGFDAFDDETLWELKSIIKNCFDAKAADVKLAVTANRCAHNSVQKDLFKGTGRCNRHACGSANIKPLMSIGTCRTGSCGRTTCRCHCQNNSTQISSSDISPERLVGGDNHACHEGALSMNHLPNDTSTAQMRKSDPDSDGAVSFVDQENVCPNSHFVAPATVAASGEGCTDPLYVGLQSPRNALRIAKRKRRFADTILKAQQKTLSDNVSMMQQEKKRLEKKQHEGKVRLDAEIIAAELRLQREKEREAARMAIQKIERIVYFDENKASLEELQMLAGCSLPIHLYLDRFGLYQKVDNNEEEK